jgi:acetoin utilization protein AcuC
MHNTKKPVFIYSQELEKYSYPPDSMFVPQRAAKTRELLMSLGLLDGKCGRESAPVRATKSELKNFHSTKYLEALQRAADGKMSREHLSMGLGTPDCPVFKDMFDFASWACGATLIRGVSPCQGRKGLRVLLPKRPCAGVHAFFEQ